MSKRASRIAWAVALAVLVCALVGFNLPTASSPAATAENPVLPVTAYISDAPLGNQPGQQLPDFTLTTLSGDAFTLSEHRGKITVINLWATWCTPCVKELPYFDQLQAAHPQDVAVLAIHSDLITSDPAAYISGFDYDIAFAVDETGEVIASLGGSTVLPQTLVINAYGEVTYNQTGSITYEMLEELVREAGAVVSE